MTKSDRCLSCKRRFYSPELSDPNQTRSVEQSDVPWYCEGCVNKKRLAPEVLMYRYQHDREELGFAMHDSDEVLSE